MNSLSVKGQVLLAGKLDDLGNSWISMFDTWSSRAFKVVLLIIVVVYMVQRFSVKAGLGALLLMVLAMGIYEARGTLAGLVEDEVKNPSNAAPLSPGTGGPGTPAAMRVVGGVR